jgi:hypothetical protein
VSGHHPWRTILNSVAARAGGRAPLYLGLFADRADVAREFEVELDPDVAIVVAAYEYEDYSGAAFVVFLQGNRLWEVTGSHCSCYGLEGQWNPEEASLRELTRRPSFLGGWESPLAAEWEAEIRLALLTLPRGLA